MHDASLMPFAIHIMSIHAGGCRTESFTSHHPRPRHSRLLIPTGQVSNTNTSEHMHKGVKFTASSASGRDNMEHLWRCINDQQAIKSLADGAQWTARCYSYQERRSVTRTNCAAGPTCRAVLRDLAKVLPLSPSVADSDAPRATVKQPPGYQEWEAVLDAPVGGASDEGATWQQHTSRTLPSVAHLEERYDELLGCGREDGESPCSSPTCSYCWRNRGRKLAYRQVCCFNHWKPAPEVVSAGAGKILGVSLADACEERGTWMLDRPSGANDVELFVSASDVRDGTTGVGHTTLGKVVYFFEHQGNDQRKGDSDRIEAGVVTVWVAVLEYVTAGTGHQRKVDPVTGFDVFHLRNTLSFFPVQALRRTVHIVHQCPTSRASTSCGLVSGSKKRQDWRCRLGKQSSYLLNKYFHSIARDPYAE